VHTSKADRHDEPAVDLTVLGRQVRAGLTAVQAAQTEYDAAMWEITEPPFSNLRHIHLHLSITVGRLAELLEPRDHDSHRGGQPGAVADIDPIVSDLLMHAAQLCNVLGRDLGEAFCGRYRQNAARFAPSSALAEFGSSQGSPQP
jgi:hypothetical protein